MADATKPTSSEILYDGDVSFDGLGHATVSVAEFNRLAAAVREVGQIREGLERMAGANGNMTILAAWPWVLSEEQCDVAAKIIDGLTRIADNLLAGKTWDGKSADEEGHR